MARVTKAMKGAASKIGRENWRYSKYIKTVCDRELDRVLPEYRGLSGRDKAGLVTACAVEIAKSKR